MEIELLKNMIIDETCENCMCRSKKRNLCFPGYGGTKEIKDLNYRCRYYYKQSSNTLSIDELHKMIDDAFPKDIENDCR